MPTATPTQVHDARIAEMDSAIADLYRTRAYYGDELATTAFAAVNTAETNVFVIAHDLAWTQHAASLPTHVRPNLRTRAGYRLTEDEIDALTYDEVTSMEYSEWVLYFCCICGEPHHKSDHSGCC